jgi:anti-sigma regulatory factor (Ser/Thr protein kinase)
MHSDRGGMTASTHAGSGFVHSALFYRSEKDYVDAVVPFVLDGLGAGEPAMVAVPGPNMALLRDALGEATAQVPIVDMTEVGRNPGRLLGVFGAFAAEHPDRRIRIVGECVWPARTVDEYPACVQHEASANAALDGCEVTGLCPYNAGQLDQQVLADARTTHPLLWEAGSLQRCPDYAPDEALARYNQPLPSNPRAVTYTVEELADLGLARSFADQYAQRLGLPAAGIADVQIIATELATNSLKHAGSACRLALWRHEEYIICEASDNGRLADPLAGRRTPNRDDTSGRGLFLVNAIADLVRIHATPAGTTIQAYLRLPASGAVVS